MPLSEGVDDMPEASAILNQIAGALDGLANEPMRLVGEDRTFLEIWGWNQPPMNRHEFSAFIRAPIGRLQRAHSIDFSSEDIANLQKVPNEINLIMQQSMPNLPSGNAFHVYTVVDGLNGKISRILDKYLGDEINWEEIGEKNIYPIALTSQMRQLQNDIEGIKGKKKGLDDKVNQIIEASNASKSLRKDLESLNSARESFLGIQRIAGEHQLAIEQYRQKIETAVSRISEFEKMAAGLVGNTKAALAAATTVGLGSEFEQKGRILADQVKMLSKLLAFVLAIAAVATWVRINEIHEIIRQMTEGRVLNLELVWANIAMTLASLSAPVWAAWMLTKQIGQRFRLSEDYAFKATVAKAYAGYNQEANRLNDPEFEKRLFETALNRIDEPPLRYVERENEGSPCHSIISKIRGKSPQINDG